MDLTPTIGAQRWSRPWGSSNELVDDSVELLAIEMLLSEDSYDEEEPRRGGSRPGKSPNIDRLAGFYAELFHRDYFSGLPTYNGEHFRRRFRMNRDLFNKIASDIECHDPYFRQKADCTGKLGLTCYQKCAAAIRALATGSSADDLDDRYRLAESTALETLRRFCEAVVAVYGESYLRYPTEQDLTRLLAQSAKRGWPGMLGSINCMHWSWKNWASTRGRNRVRL
ncbi:hypothetical protein PR001_g27083 [Phytophthora rubi]|uniref:Uncharacterized protein n=1 Tax=Phytophthora rubi TaxID=129364 RepID=A0A6A3HNA4_9STRA|nr:hypothetical protein PR001_g27083 [Phytophthora rubi]KAE8981639.1 hypothetical protein PR002_g23766 [Phytophthora rubi]